MATRWLIVGPITATALVATLPNVTGFRTSRDLSACENGGEKVGHGSGGVSLLRAA